MQGNRLIDRHEQESGCQNRPLHNMGRAAPFFQNGDDCKQHRGEDQQKRGGKGRDIELGADVKEPDQTINMLMSGQ